MSKLNMATLAIHSDNAVQGDVTDVAPPLHMSTTFLRTTALETGTDAHAVDGDSYVYARVDQPTRRRVEHVLGQLDGGTALTFSSGLAALHTLITHVKPAKIVASLGYHGCRLVVDQYMENVNSHGAQSCELVALPTPVEDPALMTSPPDLTGVDLVLLEAPTNPTCGLFDLAVWAAAAKEHGALVCVDATFVSPVGQRPLACGIDVVFHSATKYLGGHSDVLGGVLVFKDDDMARAVKMTRLVIGCVMGALESWLLLRSLRTLSARVEKHASNALRVVKWLDAHPMIERVWHPALESHPSHSVYAEQVQLPGAPATFSFEAVSEAVAKKLLDKTELFRDATSLGGVESLLDWRHRWDASISVKLLRISVGLEDAGDLCADLGQALDRIRDEEGL